MEDVKLFKMGFTYTYHETGKSLKFDKIAFANDIISAVNVIAKKVEGYSRNAYLDMKVTEPKQPSLIFSSIVYNTLMTNITPSQVIVTATIMADYNVAPHLIYVLNDRRLVNGEMWSSKNKHAPYKFLDAGILKVSPEIDGIFKIVIK